MMEFDLGNADAQEELRKVCQKLKIATPLLTSARNQPRLGNNTTTFESTCTISIIDHKQEAHEIETTAYGLNQEATENLTAKRMIFKIAEIYPYALDKRYVDKKPLAENAQKLTAKIMENDEDCAMHCLNVALTNCERTISCLSSLNVPFEIPSRISRAPPPGFSKFREPTPNHTTTIPQSTPQTTPTRPVPTPMPERSHKTDNNFQDIIQIIVTHGNNIGNNTWLIPKEILFQNVSSIFETRAEMIKYLQQHKSHFDVFKRNVQLTLHSTPKGISTSAQRMMKRIWKVLSVERERKGFTVQQENGAERFFHFSTLQGLKIFEGDVLCYNLDCKVPYFSYA